MPIEAPDSPQRQPPVNRPSEQPSGRRPVRRLRRRQPDSVLRRLLHAITAGRQARLLTAALLLVLLVSLGLVGWRGFGPLLAQSSDSGQPVQGSQPLGADGRGTGAGGLAGQDDSGTGAAASGATGAADSLAPAPPLHAESQDDDILPGEPNPFARSLPGDEATGAVTPGASSPGVSSPVPPSPEAFPGIADSVTRQWTFPMTAQSSTPVVGVFGASRNDRLHAGIDLYAPQGTEIHAMTAGTVFNVELFYQGLYTVDIANDDGTSIRYGELIPTVQTGERVEAGQLLGRLKRNYDGTCMLHLEVYATIRPEPLTQIPNQSDYPLVPVKSRSYRRRSDLVDPSAVLTLARPSPTPVSNR